MLDVDMLHLKYQVGQLVNSAEILLAIISKEGDGRMLIIMQFFTRKEYKKSVFIFC